MILTDKIVTLSYGTFSCSLQGFDDKFEILEPIAEYFRNLLIDAHQSGQGLSAPDADDLARIVGDVIAQPVEGYVAQGVVILNPVAVEDVTETAGEDIENLDETSDQKEVAADPAEGNKTLLDEVDGSRHLPEGTMAAISDALILEEDVALKVPESDVEVADDGNIFEDEDVSVGADSGEDMTAKIDQNDANVSDVGNIFDEGQAVAVEKSDSDADKSESTEESPKPIARPSRIGRVIKMKREDFDAAIRGGVIEEDPDNPGDAAAQSVKAEQGQSLSDENEADLQRLLAEAEGIPVGCEDVANPTKPKAEGRRNGVDRLQSSERRSDLERIFEEADSQLGKTDTSERRSAIHHLRAAVAATRAEKSAGHELNRHTDETPYRTDLAEAAGGGTEKSRSRRKNTSILMPLKLAFDQRIDPDKT